MNSETKIHLEQLRGQTVHVTDSRYFFISGDLLGGEMPGQPWYVRVDSEDNEIHVNFQVEHVLQIQTEHSRGPMQPVISLK